MMELYKLCGSIFHINPYGHLGSMDGPHEPGGWVGGRYGEWAGGRVGGRAAGGGGRRAADGISFSVAIYIYVVGNSMCECCICFLQRLALLAAYGFTMMKFACHHRNSNSHCEQIEFPPHQTH